MSQLALSGWRAKAPSRASMLRTLLASGRWHSQTALKNVGGDRFGARLFELHNEVDIGSGLTPVHYETRRDEKDGTRVEYRQTDKSHCDICQDEERRRPSVIIARLEAEVQRLLRRVSELESGR